jgi:hypothetical protein
MSYYRRSRRRLFQRPYVWSREKNWQPLWTDIQNVLCYTQVRLTHAVL